MIENVVILPEAVDDLVEARAWYEDRRSGLGERFLSHVDDFIECIHEEPDTLIFQADCVDWEAHRLWDFDQLTHIAHKSRVSGFRLVSGQFAWE
jgi:hypothetical protein